MLSRGVRFGEGPGEDWADGDSNVEGYGLATLAKAVPLSEQLVMELDHISPRPHDARRAQIEAVLAEVLSACRACTAHAAGMQGFQPELLPIGAYHLGVNLPEDEVDLLLVAPLSLQLAAVGPALSAELERRGEAKKITPAGSDGLLNGPGLQFELRGVQAKVLVSQNIPGLPQPQPGSIVPNMAGILAREASEKLISSVPNAEQFRALLRFVRYWAKRRGVYGAFLGFLGGAAWAICCARVCQLYPGVDLAQLVVRFFRTLSRWDWRQPLDLNGAGAFTPPPQAPGHDGQSGPCTMTVLLPVGMGISTTSLVTDTTMKITQKEFRRGYKMVQQVELVKAPWTDVYKEAQFFQRHRHYLEFDFMANSDAVFASWIAWAKQQMQDLVRLFEAMPSNIVRLRPWPEWVTFRDADWPHAVAVFVGLHLERGVGADGQQDGQRRSFDLREPIVKFLEAISSWPEAEKNTNNFELLIKHVKAAQLEQWLENRRNGMVVDSTGAAGTQLPGVGAQQVAGMVPAWSISEDGQAMQLGLQHCSL